MAKGFLNRDNEGFVSGNWPVPLALTFLESLTATIRNQGLARPVPCQFLAVRPGLRSQPVLHHNPSPLRQPTSTGGTAIAAGMQALERGTLRSLGVARRILCHGFRLPRPGLHTQPEGHQRPQPAVTSFAGSEASPCCQLPRSKAPTEGLPTSTSASSASLASYTAQFHPRLQGQSCISAQPGPPAPEANPQEVR